MPVLYSPVGMAADRNYELLATSRKVVGGDANHEKKDMLVETLAFCQEEKGLILYGWCIMSNHIHFMASARDNNLSDILRDFKKYNGSKVTSAISKNPQESRKDWMIDIFKNAGKENSRNTVYQFWRQDNHPIECFSFDFTKQKLEYIHNNPVAAGIVFNPEDYCKPPVKCILRS